MNRMSFSDGLYFESICEYCCEALSNKKNIPEIIGRMRRFVSNRRKRANGYWKLPEEQKFFVESMDSMILALENGANANVVKGIYKDLTSIIGYVNNKIKVTFLAQEESVWPSSQSVYENMLNDGRFDTQLVYVPFKHPNATAKDDNMQIYKGMGYDIVNYDKYDISKENPDIVFFTKPYNSIPSQFYIKEIEKIIDKTVYIPYGMETVYPLVRYGFQDYTHYKVWKHVVHGDFVKEVGKRYGYRDGENIVVWGHPRFDLLSRNYLDHIPAEWASKIKGKKVLCWCPHHTIEGPEKVSTWFENYKTIFSLTEQYDNILLLWRPHPMLFGALVNDGYMTQDELNVFIKEKSEKENIILDLNSDYNMAFQISDAMITDGTTFSAAYLYMDRPLMLTIPDINMYYNSEEAEKGFYLGNTPEDIEHFFDIVSRGEDPKKDERIEYKNKTLFLPEGQTVAEYIAENLVKSLKSDIEKDARRIVYGLTDSD